MPKEVKTANLYGLSSSKPLLEEKLMILPVLLLFAAIFYNAFLAFVNAQVMRIGEGLVIVTEGVILFIASIYIISNLRHMKRHTTLIIVSLYVYTVLFLWMAIANGGIFIKSLRDMVIIFIFYLLGTQCSATQLVKAFRVITLVVIGIMFIEGWFVKLYATIFQPALYYAGTRGVKEFSLDSSGLFRNSLGFEGRFSYGLFGQRRLSSVFMEQVSLANFSMVLSVFAITFWDTLKRWDKLLFVFGIVFMVVSNSSRTATALCLMMFGGYFIFPKLPKYGFKFIIPILLALIFIFFYDFSGSQKGMSDDTKGRIGHTVAMLSSIDWLDFLNGNISQVFRTSDSGYTYLIYSQTVLGFIYFCFFLAKSLPADNHGEKRFAYGTIIYIAFNLVVGAAIFSIKVSAPVWIVAGHLAAYASHKNKLT